MSLLEAIVLGLVQGLTEFLPISSSGHLVLVPWLLGWESPGLAFDAALHLGTLVAVFAYFWRDLIGMLMAAPLALSKPRAVLSRRIKNETAGPLLMRARDARLALLLIIGGVPAGVAGLLGQEAIESFFHDDAERPLSIVVIAVCLIGFGVLLGVAERVASHRRSMGDLRVSDAVAIGLAQALALIPGVSRSGSTLTAGLFRGLRRADAARFSFLVGTPLVLAAGLKGVVDIIDANPSGDELRTMVAGVLASAASGFAAIWVLLRYLQRSNTLVFVAYRVVAGMVILGMIAAGIR